ncbi:hypothetical protein CHUAL_000048 [Chamberlinius hualienensis]
MPSSQISQLRKWLLLVGYDDYTGKSCVAWLCCCVHQRRTTNGIIVADGTGSHKRKKELESKRNFFQSEDFPIFSCLPIVLLSSAVFCRLVMCVKLPRGDQFTLTRSECLMTHNFISYYNCLFLSTDNRGEIKR